MIRKARAVWRGTGRDGNGDLSTDSGVLDASPYSFRTRFEGQQGTNPEELIAAAHAGCFSMALSAALTQNGTPPETIDTTAEVEIRMKDGDIFIPRIKLTTRARVPDLDAESFQNAAKAAKEDCPVSKALAGVETIELEATLET